MATRLLLESVDRSSSESPADQQENNEVLSCWAGNLCAAAGWYSVPKHCMTMEGDAKSSQENENQRTSALVSNC